MAELRHSSSIGARASSSPMKCDEDSSPLLPAPNPTTSPAAATATARIVTVPSPPTSTPSAPFSPTILGLFRRAPGSRSS
ncbi:hypothetical protein PanWU01x14_297610 [Parasponia andersonii]|uniref:Uncharacterized protein n=1 Tax=Parasponia andersonii TaxID=3476 RepID=A0A2P5AVD2_PARAD|nr:hypothetical protein PanWU01x14_297610 [Parasponia andersonii]